MNCLRHVSIHDSALPHPPGTPLYRRPLLEPHATVVPRIVHRVWFDMGAGPVPPPDKYREMTESVQRFTGPHWTFMFWDEAKSEELIRCFYPSFLPVWRSYRSTIYKVDAIRYFILHAYGGVYMDWDVELLRPLDHLVDSYDPVADGGHVAILVKSRNWGKHISNFVMASTPGHPFFASCIARLPAAADSMWNREHSYIGTMRVAGPHFIMAAHAAWKKKKNDGAIGLVRVLPHQSFDNPKGLPEEGYSNWEWGYGHHAFHSSWGKDEKKSSDIRILWPYITVGLVLLGALIAVVVWLVVRLVSRAKERAQRRRDLGAIAMPPIAARTDEPLAQQS
ncbi:Glycosyltransferase [Mollivirus sibericum]|uniref:Glycosyltransferase n=1 Tax=Mollivirus sibericum TaxID=1678078 RepID=UPI0006B2E6B4|nr:Glycosyltransferase [Mollivirus sibericum]ALD62155.1 Glycosyltransferase [Mollivirus sibericum]